MGFSRLPMLMAPDDATYIEDTAVELTNNNQSELIRQIIDEYLEHPSKPPFVYRQEKPKDAILKFLLIRPDQMKAMNNLCRKYGNCPRTEIVREAIKRYRERRG